jgi:MarR family transcriptional regulator, lower aerobic nicotinate degradation pathway regulator
MRASGHVAGGGEGGPASSRGESGRAGGGEGGPASSRGESGRAGRAEGGRASGRGEGGRAGRDDADRPHGQAMERSPARLQRLPSWLLNQAAIHAIRIVGEAFAHAGVRRYHFSVLVALAEEGPASQASLGRRLSIDRSDMVAVVNDLERDGLVTRVRDPHDRRRNLIEITPAGKCTLDRLDAKVEEAQAAVLEPLSAPERRQLVELLGRLVEHHGEHR